MLSKKSLIKILATSLIIPLWCNAYGETSAKAELDPDPYFERDSYFMGGDIHRFDATHSYTVINNNTTDATYTICYRIIVCPDNALRAETNNCFNVTVSPGKFSTNSGRSSITYKMISASWVYLCRIYAETEIYGAERGDHQDIQHFTVKPS